MIAVARDRSRDRRIEDPTNLWLVHPTSHLLLRGAIRLGVSANMVSVAGFCLGAIAASLFYRWRAPGAESWALLFAFSWLVADGLDGMIARATGTASALGRLLDGLCDHGVFILLYFALALSLATPDAWLLAWAAGGAHFLQSTLYEGERGQFHRRLRGELASTAAARAGTVFERIYDWCANLVERAAAPFETAFAAASDRTAFGARYADRAVPAMRAMIPLSANTRVLAMWLACLAGDPRLFWWFEIGPLSVLAVGAILWHRRAEASVARG